MHRRLHRVQHPVADGAGREERIGEDGAAQGALPHQPDPAGRRQLPRHRVSAAPLGGLPAAQSVGARPGGHRHVAPRGARTGRRGRPPRSRRPPGLYRQRYARVRQPAAVADRRRREARRLQPDAPRQARHRRAPQPVVRHECRRTRPGAQGDRIAHARPAVAAARRGGTPLRRPAGRAGRGDAREAPAPVPLLRRVSPAARRSRHQRVDAQEGGERAHRRRHDLPGPARAGQHDARGPAGDRPVRVPRRRARVRVPAHHPRRDGGTGARTVRWRSISAATPRGRWTRRRSTPATSCARASATAGTA